MRCYQLQGDDIASGQGSQADVLLQLLLALRFNAVSQSAIAYSTTPTGAGTCVVTYLRLVLTAACRVMTPAACWSQHYSGLYLTSEMFNHSCLPNAIKLAVKGGVSEIRAVRWAGCSCTKPAQGLHTSHDAHPQPVPLQACGCW
jgi:hypothetical protein